MGQASVFLRSYVPTGVSSNRLEHHFNYTERTYIYGSIGTTKPYRKFSAYAFQRLDSSLFNSTLPVNSPRTAVKTVKAFELRHDWFLGVSIANVWNAKVVSVRGKFHVVHDSLVPVFR